MLTGPATTTWLLLAASLALAGPARGGGPARHMIRGGPSPGASHLSRPALRAVAAMLTGLASVAVAGLLPGLAVAAVLAPASAALAGRLADRPPVRHPDSALALTLDLTAAALRSGQTVTSAMTLTASVLPAPLERQWRRTAALLGLGAEPVQAWAALAEDPVLAPVAAAARRSANSGARLARTLSQLAGDTRAIVRAQALARANRAGVFAMAPLGLCFLPAFVCVGIVPTIVGVARGVLPGLR